MITHTICSLTVVERAANASLNYELKLFLRNFENDQMCDRVCICVNTGFLLSNLLMDQHEDE